MSGWRAAVEAPNGDCYAIELHWDRVIDAETTSSVQLIALRSADGSPLQRVAATVEIDAENHDLHLSVNDQRVGTISLDTPVLAEFDDADVDGNPDARDLWGAIQGYLADERNELCEKFDAVLDAIPACDPIRGAF